MTTDALPRRQFGVLDVVRWVILLLVLVAVAVALWRNWHDVARNLRRVGPDTLGLALLCALASPVFTLMAWRRILADVGSALHVAPASGVYFVGQLGKYVPGSVWSIVAQTEIGARLGIPRRRLGVTGLVTIGLALVTGAVVGLPAIPLLLRSRGGGTPWWLTLVTAAACLVVLAPPVLNRVVGLALRVLRREPLAHPLSSRALVGSTGWLLVSWLFMGGAVWILARSLAGSAASPSHVLAAALCGSVLAATLGMASLFVPAGVGVREAVLLLLLGDVLSTSQAAAVVVLARFLSIVVDIVAAAVGWLYARTHHLLGRRA